MFPHKFECSILQRALRLIAMDSKAENSGTQCADGSGRSAQAPEAGPRGNSCRNITTNVAEKRKRSEKVQKICYRFVKSFRGEHS